LGTLTPKAKLDVESTSTTVAPAILGQSHATQATDLRRLIAVNPPQ
jgi:hypothetical protein